MWNQLTQVDLASGIPMDGAHGVDKAKVLKWCEMQVRFGQTRQFLGGKARNHCFGGGAVLFFGCQVFFFLRVYTGTRL